MIVSFSIGILIGSMTDARAKLRKCLLIFVFEVFLISHLPFFSPMELTRHAEAAASPISYPWIISVEHIPYTADDWWMTLRFLNYEVHECQVHEIVLFYEPFPFIVNLLFASNLLTGTIGLMVGLKFPKRKS